MSSVFPEILSRLRAAKGISQRKAAAELGISQALLSHYENGQREPGLEFIAKACDYYHVTADYLLGRDGEERAYSKELRMLQAAEKEIIAAASQQGCAREALNCMTAGLYLLLRSISPAEADSMAGQGDCGSLKASAALSINRLKIAQIEKRTPAAQYDNTVSEAMAGAGRIMNEIER